MRMSVWISPFRRALALFQARLPVAATPNVISPCASATTQAHPCAVLGASTFWNREPSRLASEASIISGQRQSTPPSTTLICVFTASVAKTDWPASAACPTLLQYRWHCALTYSHPSDISDISRWLVIVVKRPKQSHKRRQHNLALGNSRTMTPSSITASAGVGERQALPLRELMGYAYT